ncbi:MAG: DUF3892 domain-containing protein [Thermaerobacter sp.]|nr:DUF3892 domain-containing protein [Thermaerobacter sp.]
MPKEKVPRVTHVRRDADGDIAQVKLSDGRVLDLAAAITLAERRQLAGVMVGAARNGRHTLKGVADGDPDNNLQNLPEF